jgi:rhodanese-related sulfurtransferase
MNSLFCRRCAMSTDYTTEDLQRRPPVVVVVEALGAPFYASGHIPGAINIPPHRIRESAPTALPDKDTTVVVYGASRGCRQAEIVVRLLTTLGYRNVSRYPDGKQGWAAAGLPLDTCDS